MSLPLGLSSLIFAALGLWFGPPHGKPTPHSMIQVFMSRRRLAWWTIDSTNTYSHRATPDAVAPLHDFDRGKDSPRNAFVLNVTRRLLGMAKSKGYKKRPLASC